MSSAAKVGAFMLLVLVILAGFILKIEDISWGHGRTRVVRARFPSVAGLDEKSRVRVAGVPKGKVTKIELTPDGQALVTLELDGDVRLHQGATAQIANLGMLGEKYVELDPGNPKGPLMTDAQQQSTVLRGSDTPSIDDVTSQVSAIATDVKAITASLRQSLGGPTGEKRIEDILDNVHEITAQVRLLIAANEMNVNATASNLKAITDNLRVEIPKIAANLDRVASQLGGTVGDNREDVRAIVENLRGLSSDLRVTAQNLNGITEKVNDGQGTVGKLINSPEAHDKLVSTLESIETGVGDVKNMLNRANRIQMAVGLKGEYQAGEESDDPLALSRGGRSALQVQLVPNPQKNRFLNLEIADDWRGHRTEKITEVTVTNPDTGQSVTTVTHQQKAERDFVFSAQAGWQLNHFGIRLGLFDSTGGVGADYRVNDRLRVTGEAFDFGLKTGDNPHLRMYGEYILRREQPNFPQVFLSTGVDDPLNVNAFTLGGGIRWSDDDLKYLMGSVPFK